MDDANRKNDIPTWVSFWIAPSLSPSWSFAVLGIAVTIAWLPLVINWRPWPSYDLQWHAGTGTFVALWIVLSISWMYRNRKWPLFGSMSASGVAKDQTKDKIE